MTATWTLDELAAACAAMRRAQGLPERITDPAVLARIAAIVARAENRQAVAS